MKNLNMDDIKVSSKLDDMIKSSIDEGYAEMNNNKSQEKHKKLKKNMIAAALAIAVGTTALRTVFSNEVTATLKLAMFDVGNYLGISKNLDDYKTVIDKAISKNGITVQLNEVILDKDEVIVSTTIKSDKSLGENGNILMFGEVYINGKSMSGSAGGSSKQIDEFTEERVLAYTLDKELGKGDLSIEIKYNEGILNIDGKETKVKGPWNFEFKSNGDTLATNTSSIKLNTSFELENGQRITLNEYRSNVVGQKIDYSIEDKDKNNSYSVILKGYDDLGNKVEFYASHEEMTKGLFKNERQTPISEDANTLILTPYAVAYPKESGRMSNDYKTVGEEFTIELK